MSEHFLGYTVSIKCRNDLGTFQGQICNVNPKDQTITLKKAFKNGIPYSAAEVVLRGGDILNLSIIDTADTQVTTCSASTVAVKKPVAKRAFRSVSECIAINKGNQVRDSPRKPTDDLGVRTLPIPEGNRTPSKKDRLRQKWNEKDAACFGTPIDNNIIDQEFDFEKNLALFNKQAVYDEINASQRPDIVRHADTIRRTQKYRHDENIIASTPAMYRQVVVPSPGAKEYVTDDGLVIPSITEDLRHQLFTIAERSGLTAERQAELMGRGATEMVLQLLGGGHRLNPHNVHQWPTVVVLCGPHRQGAVSVNCARQLASHGVKTVVFLLDPTHLTSQLSMEINLLRLTRSKLITTVQELPTIAVDLIVLALADEEASQVHQARYRAAAAWANENRAPVLAIDPPPCGTPGVDTKFSIVPLLPLAHSLDNGKLYLCNLAYPEQIFKEIGIKYSSPFGPKFVIPLHPNDA